MMLLCVLLAFLPIGVLVQYSPRGWGRDFREALRGTGLSDFSISALAAGWMVVGVASLAALLARIF
ncbi:hypothetical protein SBADM41S_08611 [Streptomyces badius]